MLRVHNLVLARHYECEVSNNQSETAWERSEIVYGEEDGEIEQTARWAVCSRVCRRKREEGWVARALLCAQFDIATGGANRQGRIAGSGAAMHCFGRQCRIGQFKLVREVAADGTCIEHKRTLLR